MTYLRDIEVLRKALTGKNGNNSMEQRHVTSVKKGGHRKNEVPTEKGFHVPKLKAQNINIYEELGRNFKYFNDISS